MTPIYKIEAQGDVVYIERDTEEEALARLDEFTGGIPRKLLKITVVDKLPHDEELL